MNLAHTSASGFTTSWSHQLVCRPQEALRASSSSWQAHCTDSRYPRALTVPVLRTGDVGYSAQGKCTTLRSIRFVNYFGVILSLGGRERTQSGMIGQQGHANPTPAFTRGNFHTGTVPFVASRRVLTILYSTYCSTREYYYTARSGFRELRHKARLPGATTTNQ